MKPCNELEIVGIKSMQPSKDYYKGYDAAAKNYIRILEKIKAEIHATAEMHDDGNYYLRDEWIDEYFDKYKVESEEKNMGMTVDNLCNSCTNIGCEFQSGIVRTKCAFYIPPHIETDNCGNYVVQNPTTPKTGHWIYGEDSVECHDGWFCSKCGHFEFWDYSFDSEVAKLHLPNFCPDCGAKMVEPQESEDEE